MNLRLTSTIQDENINGIEFSDLAQNDQIHRIEYYRILIFEFSLYEPSTKNSQKSHNERN